MKAKNLNEFTEQIIGLIHDAKAIETKVKTIRDATKNNAKFYFDEIDLNVAKIEQTLTDLFALTKPTTKKDLQKDYVILLIRPQADKTKCEFLSDKHLSGKAIGYKNANKYTLSDGTRIVEDINTEKMRSGARPLVGLIHKKNFE